MIFLIFTWLELDTLRPHSPTCSGQRSWTTEDGSFRFGPIANDDDQLCSTMLQIIHCLSRTVVKNCWWQQKVYIHTANESRSAKRHEKRTKKKAWQLRHHQKSVRWWLVFVLWKPWESKTKQRMVFRMIHVKDSLLPMGKVWSLDFLGKRMLPIFHPFPVKRWILLETPFKATSLQGWGFTFGFSKHQSRCPCRNGIHVVSSKCQRINCPRSCNHQSSTVKQRLLLLKSRGYN